ncbi:hypothetical protein [Herbaspirillum robiniae]|uniref:hypothetical protein n=1 Tax=Herbaspirillum robiniae TaxID=2014887 RepID=UPI00101AD1BE|nr:hypothetical protein [Herbaspirillum robiniae]
MMSLAAPVVAGRLVQFSRYVARLSIGKKQVNKQSINLLITSQTINKLIGDRLTLIESCFLLVSMLRGSDASHPQSASIIKTGDTHDHRLFFRF